MLIEQKPLKTFKPWESGLLDKGPAQDDVLLAFVDCQVKRWKPLGIFSLLGRNFIVAMI